MMQIKYSRALLQGSAVFSNDCTIIQKIGKWIYKSTDRFFQTSKFFCLSRPGLLHEFNVGIMISELESSSQTS